MEVEVLMLGPCRPLCLLRMAEPTVGRILRRGAVFGVVAVLVSLALGAPWPFALILGGCFLGWSARVATKLVIARVVAGAGAGPAAAPQPRRAGRA